MSPYPGIIRQSLACAFISCAIISTLSSRTFGQNADAKPVARLIRDGRSSADRRPHQPGLSVVQEDNPSKSTVKSYPSLKEATSIERRAFDMTNNIRLQRGLTALSWDPELCRMARLHSERMARQGFFSHLTPEGQGLRDRLRAGGISSFKVTGENIAYNQGYEDPGEFAVGQWMSSSGHRANILNADFESGAVGAYVALDGTVYLTQTFITR